VTPKPKRKKRPAYLQDGEEPEEEPAKRTKVVLGTDLAEWELEDDNVTYKKHLTVRVSNFSHADERLTSEQKELRLQAYKVMGFEHGGVMYNASGPHRAEGNEGFLVPNFKGGIGHLANVEIRKRAVQMVLLQERVSLLRRPQQHNHITNLHSRLRAA
jgi:hypothetical protein